jgi:hypothetical protein
MVAQPLRACLQSSLLVHSWWWQVVVMPHMLVDRGGWPMMHPQGAFSSSSARSSGRLYNHMQPHVEIEVGPHRAAWSEWCRYSQSARQLAAVAGRAKPSPYITPGAQSWPSTIRRGCWLKGQCRMGQTLEGGCAGVCVVGAAVGRRLPPLPEHASLHACSHFMLYMYTHAYLVCGFELSCQAAARHGGGAAVVLPLGQCVLLAA